MKFCNLYLPEVEVVSWIVVSWLSLLVLAAVEDAMIRMVGDRVALSVPLITCATVLWLYPVEELFTLTVMLLVC